VQRVAVIASASGCGKTTFGRALARALDVSFVELDAIHWQAAWTELDAGELRRRVEPHVVRDAWVIDGSYRGKLGDLVLERADTVVWLDLPRRIWLPRLVVRTLRRAVLGEELWNGNRESLRNAVLGVDSLFRYALANERPRRHRYPRELAGYRVARLRSPAEVDAFLRSARRRERSSATQAAPRSPSQMGVRTT
jgi:adenylate kinase family enzyme